MLRVGLAGLGRMGRNHARVLSSLPDVTLVGIADQLANGQSQYDTPVVSSVTELIDLGIDYAVVALPTAYHATAALQLAEAKIPTLIEKPLAEDRESAVRVVEAFEQAGVLGAVGHIERYNPALRQARARIENGDLGELYQVATRRQGPFPARIADVGVVKDLGSHDVDLTTWLTRSSYRTISAHTSRRSGRAHEDMVAAIGYLERGVITSHLVNWLSPIKERLIVATGDRGAYVVDTLQADLTFYANGSVPTTWDAVSQFRGVTEGNVTRYAFDRPEPLRVEHEGFRDAVLGVGDDIVTLKEGLQTVLITEAILESARSGQVIDFADSAV